jgi:hypothetical protein
MNDEYLIFSLGIFYFDNQHQKHFLPMNHKDHLFATKTLLYSMPRDEFVGLTSAEMNVLLYDPFSDGSAVTIKKEISDEVLNSIPILRLSETLVSIIIRDGYVKLTPKGMLNKKTLHELYNHQFYPEPLIEEGLYKLSNEYYWRIMGSCRDTLILAGMIRKSKGKLYVTTKTVKLLKKGNRVAFFTPFLLTFIRKFNWSINDAYDEMLVIQQNAAFPVYLLHKFGSDFQPYRFYTDIILKANPRIPEIIRIMDGVENVNDFHRCFHARFFKRFTRWFGFTVPTSDDWRMDESIEYKTSYVFDAVFQFE